MSALKKFSAAKKQAAAAPALFPKIVKRMALLGLLTSSSLASVSALAEQLTASDINDYYQALVKNQSAKVAGYFAPQVVYEDIATGEIVKGRKSAAAFVKSFVDATPGVKVDPQNIVMTDQYAAVEWLMSAGKGKDAWSVRGVALIEHKDGKITRVSDYWNN